jgi:prepilin-type processing-associated H-X9-DG protein
LPALSAAKFRAKVITCTSNYRQWGVVAAMYAGEDKQDRLPSYAVPPTAFSPWDVSLDMVPSLAPFGLTVPMWFCPTRPREYDDGTRNSANGWFNATYGRSIQNTADLNTYFRFRYRGPTAFALIYHAWWVPRPILGGNPSIVFPAYAPDTLGIIAFNTNGWPRRSGDRIGTYQPIISDYCHAPKGETNATAAADGHSVGNRLRSVNVGFADGHVETHSRSTIQWQYIGGNTTAFY